MLVLVIDQAGVSLSSTGVSITLPGHYLSYSFGLKLDQKHCAKNPSADVCLASYIYFHLLNMVIWVISFTYTICLRRVLRDVGPQIDVCQCLLKPQTVTDW